MTTLQNGLRALALVTLVTAAVAASAFARELTSELRRDRAEAASGREGGQAPPPPQQPVGPPRGSSGPPEHAKVTPINNLPNPYETIRNWGTLPDGRRWGSVSAVHVDADGKHIWAGDQEGKPLDTWYQFSRISGLYIDRNDTLYAIDSESDDNYNPGWRKGLRVGSAGTGEVWYFVPEHVSKNASGMGGYGSMGEGVAVDAQGNVFGGEVGPVQGLTKFVPRLKR